MWGRLHADLWCAPRVPVALALICAALTVAGLAAAQARARLSMQPNQVVSSVRDSYWTGPGCGRLAKLGLSAVSREIITGCLAFLDALPPQTGRVTKPRACSLLRYETTIARISHDRSSALGTVYGQLHHRHQRLNPPGSSVTLPAHQ